MERRVGSVLSEKDFQYTPMDKSFNSMTQVILTSRIMDTTSSSTLTSSSSVASSCSCSSLDTSCSKSSKNFWSRYHRGRKITSVWKSIKLIFSKKAKYCINQCSSNQEISIQRFYEELYVREHRASVSFQRDSIFMEQSISSSDDDGLYSTIIDEEVYFVPYH